MKLRKLIVSGFKSFADKTEFEFHDGISCIVGPNGCGKSNVVDAVKWVLGEQSAKSLRGAAMQDVIFNGSSARRPAGVAEVTLVFDNDQGILQPDRQNGDGEPAPVVSVTRRLYRSGQSEYLINKSSARLKDIREMFMDTGVGVDSYGVIEQGQVMNFVQASHDERRAIFDEAAGISKYKARKKEALRKLERVEQNLLRVTDILQEVEKRLRSIKLQAGKARNYQSYVERLRELRSLHLLAQYHNLARKRVELEKRLDHCADAVSQLNSRIHQLESAQSAAEVESVDLERTSRELEGQIASISGQISTCEQRVEMLTGRVEELGEQLVATSARCEELEAKIEQAEAQRDQRQKDLEALEADNAGLAEQYESIRSEHTEAQHQINSLTNELEEQKAAAVELMRQSNQIGNVLHSLQVKRENLQAQKQRLAERADQIDQTLSERTAAREELGGQVQAARDQIAASEDQLAEAKDACNRLLDSEQQLRGALSEVREQRSAVESRIRALHEMQQRLEGVAGGVRRVLAARKEGKLPFLRDMLGSLLDSDMQHAPLVEAALAGADQQLVADRLADVEAGAAELRNVLGEKGAVEVLCLDAVPAEEPADDPVPGGAQVIGRVLDWVRCEDSLAPAVRHLLGRTLAVETLADAAALRRDLPGWRFVTRSGEVLEADGRLRIGAEGRSAGVITRRSELASLAEQNDELTARVEHLQQQCQDTREEIQQLEQRQQSLRAAIYEANTQRVGLESRLGQVEEEIDKLQRERPLVAREAEQLDEQIDATHRQESEARERQQSLEASAEQQQERIEQLAEQVAASRSRFADLADQMTEVKVALAQAEQKKLSVREEAARLAREVEQMREDLAAGRQRVEMDRQRRTEAEEGITRSQEEIETLYERHQTLSGEAAEVEESRRGLKERLDEIRAQLSSQRKVHETQGEQLSSVKVEQHEVEVRIENLISRAQEEMGMNLLEQYEEYEHDAQRDWDAVAEEIEELRGKISRLGNVNLDAITEQEELEQRHAFLTEQLADVEASRKQLSDLIDRINRESRELFLQTFQTVRENFQNLFRKLFGGGKADVLLADPEDVLESHIEIMARPPGKELRSLSLLSGGEKTMTALALLFSIFRSKPSPFCLLDEVDAALDEANIDRFSRLLVEFNDASQFIVITHAKRTMAVGDLLYGVTMQEPGVSKRISVKFDRVEEVEEQLEPVGA